MKPSVRKACNLANIILLEFSSEFYFEADFVDFVLLQRFLCIYVLLADQDVFFQLIGSIRSLFRGNDKLAAEMSALFPNLSPPQR